MVLFAFLMCMTILPKFYLYISFLLLLSLVRGERGKLSHFLDFGLWELN